MTYKGKELPLKKGSLSAKDWVTIFQPIPNFITGGFEFDWVGKDRPFLDTVDHHHVWTNCSDCPRRFGGYDNIYPGFVHVNRMVYYITAEPWTEEIQDIWIDRAMLDRCLKSQRQYIDRAMGVYDWSLRFTKKEKSLIQPELIEEVTA